MNRQDRDLSVLGAHLSRLFDWLAAQHRFAMPAFYFSVGVLLSRAFAPVNFFPAVFISMPLMVIFLDRAQSGREAFRIGWWIGFGLFAVGLSWIAESFKAQANVPEVFAAPAVIMLCAVMALYTGVTFWVAFKLWSRSILRILLFACVWTVFEVARGMWFTGFPWHLAGAIWADWLYMAQATHYLSVYGLSFLTVLVAGSLACLADQGSWQRMILPSALGALIIGVLAVLGAVRVDTAQTRYHLGVTMRLVQANVQQREKWLSYLIEDHFDKHMSLSRAGNEEGKAKGIRLLIWPETAVQRENFDREGSLHRWRMSKLLDYGAFAITGSPRYRQRADGDYDYYNSLFAINSDADIYARYDKNHLVPFGEFLPFESWLKSIGLSNLAGGAWTPGRTRQTIHLPGIPGFSPLVCYEAIFPGRVLRDRETPAWLLNITNDGWFGTSEGPYQHLALARLRAIEEGLPLVRAASTGVSAVIDGYGRTISQLPVGRQGVLDSPLPVAVEAPAIATGAKIILLMIFNSLVLLARAFYCWRGNSGSEDAKKVALP
ncbi:MAG: apolipoprotein N-acyltransferase [Alphaproteobacteria bacterium]|nr:apolipoprotein N-acyltransferase [Alphaproteobacteria bacterium]